MAKAKILVVEDEEIVAQDIAYTLSDYGYQVCGTLSSGEEAVKAALMHKPDLILMDIRIRGPFDGVEAARRIWEKAAIPVIFLTAHSDEQTLSRAKTTRPFAYLLKPFEARELYVTIEIALTRRPAAPCLEVPAWEVYQGCRQLLAAGRFGELPDGGQLLPPPDLAGVDDLTADVLDILCAVWLQQSEQPEAWVTLSADDLLRSRQLLEQKSGTGLRGGFEDKWRRQMAQQIGLLSQIRLLAPGESPLIECSPAGKPYTWHLRPGPALAEWCFGPQRRTALLSQQVLAYDPYRQKWEKRQARHLSQAWGQLRAEMPPQPVSALLEAVDARIDAKHPVRTKERFEQALETLAQDDLIASWRYENGDEATVGKKGWLEGWKTWLVSIRIPQPLMEQYAGLPGVSTAPGARPHAYAFIREIRQARGISQLQAAAEIGVTQAKLSQIENGEKPSAVVQAKLRQWILDKV